MQQKLVQDKDNEEDLRRPLVSDDHQHEVREPAAPPRESAWCLGAGAAVPVAVQYLMPVLLFLCAAIFAGSNLAVGASVFVVVNLGDERIVTQSLFDFTLGNSVRDMWNAEVYALSLIILIFSGIWPYLKLAIMLVCWWLPAKFINSKLRERMLMVLDALGKWSLIDSFVLTMMMVAFHFHLDLSAPPGEQSQPGSSLSVYVNPGLGFYCFLFATIFSLILTHVVLHFERATTSKQPLWENNTPELALRRAAQKKGGFGSAKATLSINANPGDDAGVGAGWRDAVVTPVLASSVVLQVVGAYVLTFRFTFGGIAAWALNLIQQEQRLMHGPSLINRPYSLFSLGETIPDVADVTSSQLGMRAIQATFFLFAFVVPLCQVGVLLVLWNVPLRLRRQTRLFLAAEVLHAWSGLEVLVFSIVVALLELGQFVQFIVRPYCDPSPGSGSAFILPGGLTIDGILRKASGAFQLQLAGDDTCFDVHAELDMGCWLLFAASLLSLGGSSFVLTTCHSALERRRALGPNTSEQRRRQATQVDGHLVSEEQLRHQNSELSSSTAFGGSE